MQRDGGPGGPGAGGNPTGGSFTGPAQALEIAGNFGYAYSGPVQIGTSAVTHLKFTSGNFIYLTELTCSGQIQLGTEAAGGISIFQVFFNGAEVMRLKIESKEETSPTALVIPLLIPSYTEVEVSVDSDYGSTDFMTCASMVGRIYRG